MNYRRIYDEFIADRLTKQPIDGYFEKHHILPRSLGGSDDASNLIRLTAGDHYFAHLVLAKAYGGSMWSSVWAMAKLRSSTHSRNYFAARRWVAVARQNALAGENNPSCRSEVRAAKSRALKGRTDHLIRGAAHWTRNVAAVAISGVNNPNYGNVNSEAVRAKMGAARKGKALGDRNAMRKPEVIARRCGENHHMKNPETVARLAVLSAETQRRNRSTIRQFIEASGFVGNKRKITLYQAQEWLRVNRAVS